MDDQLLLIFIIITGAAVIPFLSRIMRFPAAALEILLGILLFNSVFSHVPEWFSLLKEIGLLYLMFIAGMELDLHTLLKNRTQLVWYTALPLISLAVTPLLFLLMGFTYYTGIAVSVLSAGIVIPVLKETRLIKSALGRHIVGISLSGELLAIAVLTGFDVYHKHGLTPQSLVSIVKLIILLLAAALFLKVLRLVAWWNPKWVANVMESEDPVEEGIRCIIAIAFAGAVLASYEGIEPILGSFMAGVVFSYIFRSKGRFDDKINAVGFGFFTPFFFIGVGAGFDLSLLGSLHTLTLALFMSAMVFANNIYPVIFSRALRLSTKQAFAVSCMLSTPLSMIVVAGALGIRMDLITPEINSTLILTGLITSLVFPSVFRILVSRMPMLKSEW